MFKPVATALVALALVLLIAILLLAWEGPIAEQPRPAEGDFSQQQIDTGAVIAGLGNCQSCHTVDADQPYAGGRAFPTAFGTLYATNITPDPEQGIGRWSEAAFIRAMREGVARDGSHLFPAFPYTHFTKVRDEDLQALYAYLMTRKAVNAEAPENELEFPFNIRLLQAGWKLLFFEPGVWQPRADKSDDWNRGAYLAEGLAHCSACHTPRNSLGAEDKERFYQGAMVNDWYAPALTAANPTPVSWTQPELYAYLREGASPYHGVALGSMADVVHAGLGRASDEDIQALAVYFRDIYAGSGDELADTQHVNTNINASAEAQTHIAQAQQRSQSAQMQNSPVLQRGEQLFSSGCAACHYNAPDDPQLLRPELSLNSALSADNPVNLIRATLHGVGNESGVSGVIMPGFASWSNADLAALFQFMRAAYTDQPPWDSLQQQIERQRTGATKNLQSTSLE